jgi:Ca2+-binding RTX toxin-like protein
MAVSGTVSIPSAVGSSTVLTVTGARTLAYAQLLESYLDHALQAGTLALNEGQVSSSGSISFAAPTAGKVNEAVVSSNENAGIGIGGTATVPDGYQAVFDNVNGASTVIGPTTGVDAIFAGLGAAATFVDNGGDNLIVFVDGNNTYLGDTLTSATSDTIAGGSGFDTITTGAGLAAVYSGTGHESITLNDTIPVSDTSLISGFNQYVDLGDGQSTVFADGIKDVVVATASGQVIDGGTSAADYTAVVLATGAGAYGDDLVNAGAATVSVFDASSGNSVVGGSGELLFIGGSNITAQISDGSGASYLFGGAGDSITWTSDAGSYGNVFVAGDGNETLNGAAAQGNLAVWGNNSSDAAVTAQINDVLAGGSGNDSLTSGAGNETLLGGTGDNVFVIDATTDGVGAHITLGDFTASADNIITFEGYSTSEIDAALAGAHTVAGAMGGTNTVFTLSDNTTVTVIGISSLTGHTFGG